MRPPSPHSTGPERGPRECGRPDLAQRLAAGEEIAGNFALEIGAHAEHCSACSVRLSLLQQAERWMADYTSSNIGQPPSAGPCPSAEDLFDFGRGPGARHLPLASTRRIEAHLVGCDDCRGLIATLASRPPAPLVAGIGLAAAETPAHRPRPRPSPEMAPPPRIAPARRWLSVAAAALLMVGTYYWWDSGRSAGDRPGVAIASVSYPRAELLRGDSASALHYPRARVLAAAPDQGPGTWQELRFVIAGQPRAELYRVEVSFAPPGALGRGESIASLESAENQIEWSKFHAAPLAPGRYTWEAWVRVDRLDRSLGRRDFEIAESPLAHAAIEERARLSEPERSSEILSWLVQNGFTADARAFALELPPSPERDDFIALVPGR